MGEAASYPTKLGRYELITRIGQGGMAEVQLALQRGPAGFEKLVVVKLVHASLASQKAFVDMLLDEARVAALVKHPNVVDIYDLGQADGRFFIAMEYLEGEPLLAVLRAGREGKRLDVLSTGRLIADTAEGLDAAHELRSMSGERLELVHHDISLGNIVVLYNGQVKLVDFGVAKATQSARDSSKVQGKFGYMAPEKLGGAPGDRRSDIFSLGCVMWEALTLKRLFRGGNDAETVRAVMETTVQPPSKVSGDVPPEYDAIVMRALARDPEQRYGTAKELAVDIEEVLRRRGYGAKNDRVARYMQETFRAHIEARKKLVQEVVNKGSASAEVLDAAFSDPVLASGTPGEPVSASGDFARRDRDGGGAVGNVINAWADSSKPTTISAPPDFANTDLAAVPIDPALEIGDPSTQPSERPFAERGRAVVSAALDRGRRLASEVAERGRAILADPRKRLLAIAGAGALVLVFVLVVAVSGGDGEVAAGPTVDNTGASAGSAAGAGSGDPDSVVGVAGGSGSNELGSGEEPLLGSADESGSAAVGSADPNIDPGGGAGSPGGSARPPRPVDVEGLVNRGVTAFVKGDTKGALALLLRARAAKPGYAPTYRVLGKVYKKLGDRAAAKKAYLRYLALAPNAPDAPQIREELGTL